MTTAALTTAPGPWDLNALLTNSHIDPRHVIVMRHRPQEPELRKVLPWLAAEKPDVFNAFQQTQTEKAEKAMLKAKFVASFIGHELAKALFVGVYSIGKATDVQPILGGSRLCRNEGLRHAGIYR